MDVVIAYYNEPTSEVHQLVSRIRSELTWARVRVIVYHKGIPGFGEGRGLVGEGEVDVKAVIQELARSTGADLVIPRRNIGRDMGVYLNHMYVVGFFLPIFRTNLGWGSVNRWDELAQQTIFLQGESWSWIDGFRADCLVAQPHEMYLVWQKLRLLNPSVGFMS